MQANAWVCWALSVVGLCSVLVCVSSGAVIITESENWNSGVNTEGWGSLNGNPVVSPAGGGNPAGFLRLIDNVFGPEDLYTSSTFIGNYAEHPSEFLAFDMRVSAANPRVLYFESITGVGLSKWEYVPLAGPINVWSSYTASFGNSADWSLASGSGVYEDALTNVVAVGFEVLGSGPATFDVDNFRRGYTVPEPSTVYALLASFCSLGITFRRKLSASATHLLRLAQRSV